MNASEILLDGFSRIKDGVHGVLDGIDEQRLGLRVAPDANTIAWLIWHLTRVQDAQVADVAGHDQVWTTGGWYVPAARRPDLIVTRDVGNLRILDSGEVPDQPGDGVRVRRHPEAQSLFIDPVEDAVHPVLDAAESVEKNFGGIHLPICTPSTRRAHKPGGVGREPARSTECPPVIISLPCTTLPRRIVPPSQPAPPRGGVSVSMRST